MTEIFVDTANIDEITEAASYGFVTGVTTNPKIFSQEGNISPMNHTLRILGIIDGPVSVEVISTDTEGMVKEALEYSEWHENIVIKLPIGVPCLKAMTLLRDSNIKTNITACMSTSQALLAALNGATYVSLFYGRIGDLGFDPYIVVKETADLFKKNGIKSKIIVGSIRSINDINRAILAGADVLTIPFKFLAKLAENPQTDATIKEFTEAWNAVNAWKTVNK